MKKLIELIKAIFLSKKSQKEKDDNDISYFYDESDNNFIL